MPEPIRNPSFQPVHSAHAIVQVQFVVQIDGLLDDGALREAIKAITDQLGSELPARQDLQQVAFNIGAGAAPAAASAGLTGRMFRKVRPDGTVEDDLRVSRDSIVFITSSYTRWDAVWRQASSYFAAVMPVYLRAAKLAAVGLNYGDKFTWDGDPKDATAGALLRSDSTYLSPHIFAARDLWHSYTGAFLRVANHTKRLINVTVDCVDEAVALDDGSGGGPKRVIGVKTMLSDIFNQPGYEPIHVDAEDAPAFISRRMNELHRTGKDVFANIIGDDMSKRIGLTD